MSERIRISNSLLWVLLTVVTPFRVVLEQLGILLWPSISPFTWILQAHSRYVPLTAIVLVGYGVTFIVLTWLVRSSPEIDQFFEESHGSPKLRLTALSLTSLWMVIAVLTGAISYPLFLGALIVYSAFIDFSKFRLPEPTPIPPPEPSPITPDDKEEDLTGDREDGDFYVRLYDWLYNEEPFRKTGRTQQFSCSLRIPKAVYDECKGKDHTPHAASDYVKFANAQIDDETIKSLAEKLKQISAEHAYDELAQLHLTMAFTLSMPYAYDDAEYGREYPKFPVEMLVDKRGDCEDFSILCGTIFYNLSFKSALVLMDFTDSSTGHAALGVVVPFSIPFPTFVLTSSDTGEEYVYCEVTPGEGEDQTTRKTTGVQWRLGQMNWNTAINFKLFPIG